MRKKSKPEQAFKLLNPPFRLPGQIKHSFQWAYLHCINKVAPEVKQAITQFTPQCVKLLGNYPVAKTYQEKNNVYFEIAQTFYTCIWKDRRDNYASFNYLRRGDKILSKILENEKKIDNQINQYVASLSEEQLNSLREEYASDFTKPKESLTIDDLQFSHRRRQNEEYAEIINIQHSKLKLLIEFQQKFDSLLEKFCLEKEWLARSVFEAMWNGTGILEMEPTFREDIPKVVISKIKNQQGGEEREYDDWFYEDIPQPKPFVYPSQHLIYFGFKDYEENAVEAYRQYLQDYFKVIKEAFITSGYKENKGRPFNYEESAERLVRWNIQNWTMKQISAKYNTSKKRGDIKQFNDFESSVHSNFEELEEKYDLPRKYKKHSKK